VQAFLHNPASKSAEENREIIIEGMLKSLKTLCLLADGNDPLQGEGERRAWSQQGELLTSFSNFEVRRQGGAPPNVYDLMLEKINCGLLNSVGCLGS
jgi:hypothetical protein